MHYLGLAISTTASSATLVVRSLAVMVVASTRLLVTVVVATSPRASISVVVAPTILIVASAVISCQKVIVS